MGSWFKFDKPLAATSFSETTLGKSPLPGVPGRKYFYRETLFFADVQYTIKGLAKPIVGKHQYFEGELKSLLFPYVGRGDFFMLDETTSVPLSRLLQIKILRTYEETHEREYK